MRDIDDYSEEQNIFYGRCRGAKEAALNAFIDLCDVTSKMTRREYQVYQLRKRNYSHNEIAEALGITEKTSRVHYSSANKKIEESV